MVLMQKPSMVDAPPAELQNRPQDGISWIHEVAAKVVIVGIRSRIDFAQTESSRSIESWNRGFYQIYSNKIFCMHTRNLYGFSSVLTLNMEQRMHTSMLVVFHFFLQLTYHLARMYGTYMRGKYIEHLNLQCTKFTYVLFRVREQSITCLSGLQC